MKIKTQKEIEDMASSTRLHFVSNPTKATIADAWEEGYKQAQSDLLESTSEGFKEYVAQNNGLYFGDDHRKEMDSKVWQACSIHHAKLIKEKDERINELKDSVANLEFLFEGWQKDYKEAVKEIKNISFHLNKMLGRGSSIAEWDNAYESLERVKSKYGLDKQERKV